MKKKMIGLEQKEFDDQRKKNTQKRAEEVFKMFEQQQIAKQKLMEMEEKLDQCRVGGGYDVVKANKIKQQYQSFIRDFEYISNNLEQIKSNVVEISPYSQIYMKKKAQPKPSFSPMGGGIGQFLASQQSQPKPVQPVVQKSVSNQNSFQQSTSFNRGNGGQQDVAEMMKMSQQSIFDQAILQTEIGGSKNGSLVNIQTGSVKTLGNEMTSNKSNRRNAPLIGSYGVSPQRILANKSFSQKLIQNSPVFAPVGYQQQQVIVYQNGSQDVYLKSRAGSQNIGLMSGINPVIKGAQMQLQGNSLPDVSLHSQKSVIGLHKPQSKSVRQINIANIQKSKAN